MSRAHAKFTQADLSRAFKAAKDAGVFVRIEIEPEKMTIVQLPENTPAAPSTSLDSWRARHARSG